MALKWLVSVLSEIEQVTDEELRGIEPGKIVQKIHTTLGILRKDIQKLTYVIDKRVKLADKISEPYLNKEGDAEFPANSPLIDKLYTIEEEIEALRILFNLECSKIFPTIDCKSPIYIMKDWIAVQYVIISESASYHGIVSRTSH